MFVKRSLSSAVLVALTLGLISGNAWAWPFGEKKTTQVAASPAPAKASAPAPKKTTASKVQTDKSDSVEPQQNSQPLPQPIVPSLPEIYKVPKYESGTSIKKGIGVPQIPTQKDLVTHESVKPAAPASYEDPEIMRLQNQIKEIIQINEDLKINYSDQAAQIQKISEQAKIHEKILKDLEDTRNLTVRPTENYLTEEKVRQIQKQTAENRQLLASIQNEKSNNVTSSAPSTESEPENS